MAQEALNLTKALKGDNKTQGNWGEVVLTRVLEASGLREGYEYETQVSIQLENNSRMQPDVIVRLPQGKDVVIDAKMTLVAYERYYNGDDDVTREIALNEHIAAVRNHIRMLGRKDYQQLRGLGVEVKREINPDLVEQARLEEGDNIERHEHENDEEKNMENSL